MKAQAHSAVAEGVHFGPFHAGHYAADSDSERSLPTSARLRAAAIGVAIALIALVAVTAGGLAIVAGPFHTALGSIG